jgi:hypothetical protein
LLVLGLIIATGAIITAVLAPAPGNQYLSPASASPEGTHALADILAGLGRRVTLVTSVPAATAAATAGSTLVITSPGYLTSRQLMALTTGPANLMLVEPVARSLAAINDGVSISGTAPVLLTAPGCTLRAAAVAWTADLGGTTMNVTGPDTGQQCYLTPTGPTLIQLRLRGRLVTILGTGTPLANANLARDGNAALAINLLATRRIIWLVPPPASVPVAGPPGPRSFGRLVPLAAYLVGSQLVLAILLAIAWRGRRLGPLIFEPLPVVVRASETVEGHGRLYQSRHARGRAADALRTAVVSRVAPAIGLPRQAPAEAVVAALAERTGRDPARLTELLYGPLPGTDQALVALAGELDRLEREAGTT